MDRKPLKSDPYWLGFFLLFVTLASLPEILIALTSPEGMNYAGGLINTDDLSVYFSAIRQGAESAWLFTPQFSPEPIPAQFSYFPFLLAGRLMNLIGGSPMLWYQLLRGAAILLIGLAMKSLIETVFPEDDRRQRTAWLIVLFGSGVGWVVSVLLGQTSPLTPDLYTPEWSLLTAFFSSPHFLLGIAGQAWFISFILQELASPTPMNLFFGFAAACLLAATYPFLAVVDGLLLVLFFATRWAVSKRIAWREVGFTLVQSLPLLASLMYYGILLPQDPYWARALLSGNLIKPPPAAGMLVGTGIILVLALVSLVQNPRFTQPARQMILCWLLATLISIYLPFSFAGRLLLGFFLPLALLAADGLENIMGRIQTPQQGTMRRVVLWLTFPSTLLLLVWAAQIGLTYHQPPYFHSAGETAAAEFLSRCTTAEDLILAEYSFSNYLPSAAPARVFAGHLNLTLDLDEKLAALDTFWDPETSLEWRETFLQQWGITYVVLDSTAEPGIEEQDIPASLIYQQNQLSIFQVNP